MCARSCWSDHSHACLCVCLRVYNRFWLPLCENSITGSKQITLIRANRSQTDIIRDRATTISHWHREQRSYAAVFFLCVLFRMNVCVVFVLVRGIILNLVWLEWIGFSWGIRPFSVGKLEVFLWKKSIFYGNSKKSPKFPLESYKNIFTVQCHEFLHFLRFCFVHS